VGRVKEEEDIYDPLSYDDEEFEEF